MNTELRKYAIRAEDWHLIDEDNIFKTTRVWLNKGLSIYPLLVFDIDQWSGSNYPVKCENRGGKLKEIEIEIYES